MPDARACLKNHFRNLQAPFCGIFYPYSVAVARYAALIRIKSPTNCDAHLAESLFQTRSSGWYGNGTQNRVCAGTKGMITEEKSMITTILWDVDATLLDFLAAEKAAIKKLFQEFALGECTDEMIRRYSKINRSYWERLECGELTKPEVLVGRFREFFETEGIRSDVAEAFNDRYQLCLGDTIVFRDNSYEIVKSLRGKVKQYVVSNGTVVAQEKKLRLSGLGELMDGIFLSEALGVEKPNVEFFERMFETIDPVEKDQVLIVGDSLTSDIRGGNNAGIQTCWYNPDHKERYADVKIDYEIADLHEVYELLS